MFYTVHVISREQNNKKIHQKESAVPNLTAGYTLIKAS